MFDSGKTKVQIELEIAKGEALQYLKDTDWYVIRFKETGKEIPEEITLKRIDSREIL